MSTPLSPPTPGKNKYLVWDQNTNQFVEFSMKIGESQTGNFLEILVAPAVRRPGFLSHKKQVYHLSIHDLLRNHFNVTKPYVYPATSGENTSRSTSVVGGQPASNRVESATKSSARDELDEESSVHWKEQIDSLLYSENPEEGWILEEVA